MSLPRRRLLVGNWKMNGQLAANEVRLEALKAAGSLPCELAVCLPFPYLAQAAGRLAGSPIAWGAQDCSAHAQGAFTGEVSAAMLADFGCRYALVGHSERRQHHGEGDELVAEKARASLGQGVTPIVCVGESLAQRRDGATAQAVKRQLSAVIHALGPCVGEIVVAYEPVWAIGSGLSATPEEAQAVHALLRAQLVAATPGAARVRLLYGGSVKPGNAQALMAQPDLDGLLVGGASLQPSDFLTIARALA